MGKPRPYNSREVTKHLRQLAAEAHDWTEDGVITKGEALAMLLWKRALGWEEEKTNAEGISVVVKHEPAAWAIQLVYDRMEGKTPQAITEDETKVRAADRVRELAKSRMNDITAQLVTTTKKGPPRVSPKGTTDGE